jgi:hypothetical protein
LFYLYFNNLNKWPYRLAVAAKLRTFSCTPNKTLLALPPFAGRKHVGSLAILAHVFVPQSWVLAV